VGSVSAECVRIAVPSPERRFEPDRGFCCCEIGRPSICPFGSGHAASPRWRVNGPRGSVAGIRTDQPATSPGAGTTLRPGVSVISGEPGWFRVVGGNRSCGSGRGQLRRGRLQSVSDGSWSGGQWPGNSGQLSRRQAASQNIHSYRLAARKTSSIRSRRSAEPSRANRFTMVLACSVATANSGSP